jgi:hypothetical protein
VTSLVQQGSALGSLPILAYGNGIGAIWSQLFDFSHMDCIIHNTIVNNNMENFLAIIRSRTFCLLVFCQET